jgi:molybdate transport system substrate-binding protein
MRKALVGLLAMSLLTACSGNPDAGKEVLNVAAASDLTGVFAELEKDFEAANPGVNLVATFGSSGMISTQIRNNGPFDVYLSADAEYPKALVSEGFGEAADLFTYATGQLVVWCRKDCGVDPATIANGIDPKIEHFAIANPQHAPYGKAAMAALHSMKLDAAVKDKLVIGESVTQAAAYVQSGSAQAGMVSASMTYLKETMNVGPSWVVPPDKYPKMEQTGMIVKTTQHRAAAEKFREFILSEKSKAALLKWGFGPL